MKLISMTDFVLEKGKTSVLPFTIKETFKNGAKVMNEIFMYADFLKQPLKLEMFVPCDENGNIYVDYRVFKNENGTICVPYEGLFEIEANKKCKGWKYLNLPQEHKEDQRYYDSISYQKAFLKYREAQEKVLFENFEISTNTIGEKLVLGDYTCLKVSDLQNGTIEDLTKYVHIKLTETALKEIGLLESKDND